MAGNEHQPLSPGLCEQPIKSPFKRPLDISSPTESNQRDTDPNAAKKRRTLPPPSMTSVQLVIPSARNLVPEWTDVAIEFSIPSSWESILKPLIENEDFGETLLQYSYCSRSRKIFPPKGDIFAWTRYCNPQDVRVIIVGQDPYPTEGHAHGLAFSVPRGCRIPPSLRRILEALRDCYPSIPKENSGCLESWARKGVLLLNKYLTVEQGFPRSHSTIGWDKFTKGVISSLLEKLSSTVLMLWGQEARRFIPRVPKNHLKLEFIHPSTCTRRPFNCRHFEEANQYFESKGLSPIDWNLD
uniref:Uracil-DNA glycosylase n=1 Tax=Infectious laryngotracheitis virus TaxID=10386 RepID=Q69315_ILTV|nr:uracil-DNA glycosylase [Gallid alphaherpesvirus 1]